MTKITYRGQPVDEVIHDRRRQIFQLIGEDGGLLAELQPHEFLSQPRLRSLPHGRHRKPRPAVYRGPAGKSYYPIPSGAFFTWTVAPNPARPIEDAGIRAGEIIAHRCWRIEGGLLRSVYRRQHIWRPGEPMTGDVRGEYGVHAFNERGLVSMYCEMTAAWSQNWVSFKWNDDGSFEMIEHPDTEAIFAIGTVALWGEVIEHERGYRAEFARIASIDSIRGKTEPSLLAELRERYGVAAAHGVEREP